MSMSDNKVLQVLEQAARAGVELYVEQGRLRFRAGQGGLQPDLRAALAQQREELIAFLQRQQVGQVQIEASSSLRAPLSPAQNRLYYLAKIQATEAHYNMALALTISGALDVARLQQALLQLLQRHAILRTTFGVDPDDGSLCQRITALDQLQWKMEVREVQEGDQAGPDLQQQLAQQARQPFALERDPMLRACLYKSDAQQATLLLVLHHIAFDGWSYRILLAELAALYQGQQLPAPALQYADLARWWAKPETQAMQAAQGSRTWWQTTMQGVEALNDFPPDYARSAQPDQGSAHYRLDLHAGLGARLKARAASEGVSLFALMYTAFALLHARWSWRSESVLATAAAGRELPQVQEMPGFFVNTLPLRLVIDPTLNFSQLLARAARLVRESLIHQALPLEEIVKDCIHTRDSSYAPLVQTYFALEEEGPLQCPIPGLQISCHTVAREARKFDLELTLHSRAETDDLSLEIGYAPALYAAASVQEIGLSYQQLLQSLLAQPQMPVAQLSLCCEESLQQIARWNAASPLPTEREGNVISLFLQQVRHTPDAPACLYRGQGLTYRQLEEQSRALAQQLRARGAGREQPVGIALSTPLQTVLAVLAVLRSASAYLPLDPGLPSARLQDMLAISKPVLILGDAATPSALSSLPQFCDIKQLSLTPDPHAQTLPALQAGDAAYVIFTSGSTGTPKGVVIEQQNLYTFICAMQTRFKPGAGSIVPWLTNLSFDIHVLELLLPLASGGALACIDFAHRRAPHSLIRDFAEYQVNWISATPATWQMLLDAQWQVDAALTLVSGGEALTPALKERLLRLAPGIRLYNAYGPTEATVFTSIVQITAQTKEITIGHALPGTRYYVLDSGRQMLPPGACGELWIGGDQLARGYLQRPDLTQERFVPDPFQPGSRMYKSGDVARWRGEAGIEVLGRVDFQVKLRGQRIELGEIEACLERHPLVKKAVVTLTGDSPEQHNLLAYICPQQACASLPHDWRTRLEAHLSALLPQYMVPALWMALDAFALNSSGKVDRKALPAPVREAVPVQQRAATEVEHKVAAVWAQLFDLSPEQVDVTQNFFQAGGHSLLAVRFLHQLDLAFGLNLPLEWILLQPTVRAIAAKISAAGGHPPLEQAAAGRIQALARQDYPLSPVQRALWTLDQIQTFGHHYTIPLTLELRGELDLSRLQAAMHTMLQRHSVLRTVFRVVDGEPRQIILDNDFTLPLTELATPAQMKEISKQVQGAPFQLDTGPLTRAHLLRLDQHRHQLLLAFHHMVMDGWSLSIFIDELCALYRGEVLPPPALQYGDYSAAMVQQEMAAEDAVQDGTGRLAQRQFWQQALQGAPVAHSLPLDRPRAASPDHQGAHWVQALDPQVLAGLRQLAQEQHTTLFSVMQAALAIVLTRFSNENEIVIGVPVANRNAPQLGGMIGYFANVLPLYTVVDGGDSFIQFLARCHQNSVAAFSRQSLTFDQIVDAVKPPRSMQHNPLFQILLAIGEMTQSSAELGAEPGRLQMQTLLPEEVEAKYELALGVEDHGDSALLYWTYASALFDEGTVANFDRALRCLLAAIVAQPQTRLDALPLVSPEEEAVLLQLGQGEIVADRFAQLAQQRIAQLAKEQGTASALRWQGQTISYAELDAKARRIAALLLAQGQQGCKVGIVLPRSSDFILAQLGILYASAVFVPIDPNISPARLRAVLQDATITVLLTGSAQADALAVHGCTLILLDALAGDEPGFKPPPLPALDDAAYIVFTSGSTGTPKGALNSHRGLLNLCQWQIETFDMNAESVMTVAANVAFDSILWEIWPTLLAGGTLVITPDETLKDPLALSAMLQQHQPSHFWLPTGLMEAVCSVPFTWPASIRWAFTGGDRLSRYCLPPQVKARLFNLYGPSEAAVLSSWAEVLPDGPLPVPIGHALPNMALYILDAAGRLLPRGAVGELCIAGSNVGLGYLNRPALNAEKFVANPYARHLPPQVAGRERMYRSGDYARWRADGSLDCLGRIDMQVKIRGFRIEPQEVAHELMQSAALSAAFVDVLTIGAEKSLAAYLVAAPDLQAEQRQLEQSLRQHVSQTLPAYMQPARYKFLPELPLTSNGKVDRRALAALWQQEAIAGNMGNTAHTTPAGQVRQVNTASPRDHLEMQIYRCWREVLLQEQIGIRDSFFDVGGSSVSAIKVMGNLNRQFELSLPVATLFSAPTIEALGGEVRAALQAKAANLPPAMRSHLIDFRHGRRRRNVICVHPGGGTAFCYMSLAKLVPEQIGVFGIQARGVQEGEELLPGIHAMAVHYIGLIEHLLDGPVAVLGASFGGLVAYEMSRLLHERGISHSVGIMLDADTTDDPEQLARVKGVSAEVFRQKLVTYNGMYPGIDDKQIERYHAVYNHNLLSICDFAGLPHNGRCVLMQPTAGRDEAALLHGQRYWLPRVRQGLVAVKMAGDHSTMLEAPPVLEVVATVLQELELAQQRMGQSKHAGQAME